MDLFRENSGFRHIPFSFAPDFYKSSPAERATGLYVSLMAALLPLALHDGYFDVTEAKQVVFLALTGAYLLALLALLAVKQTRPALLAGFAGRFTLADLCMALFALSSLAGALLSGESGQFFAADSRYQGVASTLGYAAIWFCLTRLYRPRLAHAACALAAFAAACLLGSVQRCGWDLFALRAQLLPIDRGRFLSTIGNIDFYGAYLCLVLPALPYLLCTAERPRARALYAALLLLGVCGAVSTGSDGASVALCVSALAAPLLLKGRAKQAQRLLVIYACMLLAAWLFAFLAARGDPALYFSRVTRALLRPGVTLALAALSLLGVFLLRRPRPERVYKAYGLALLALAAACAAAVALFSTVLSDLPLGPLARLLRFDADWGTDRGRIWRFCLETYGGFSPLAMLFGGGPNCLLLADSAAPLFSDALVDTAHNEYLHYLLTAGALGCAAYCALLVSLFARALRRRGRLSDALLLPLLAYAVHALVGIAQPTATPLFFVLLAVLGAVTKDGGTPKGSALWNPAQGATAP